MGCWIICYGVVEIFVDDVVEIKVVFIWNSFSVRFEGIVVGRIVVGVKGVSVEILLEFYCSVIFCCIFMDIYIIYREILGMIIICYDVKVVECVFKVIFVVNFLLYLVEVVGCLLVFWLVVESFYLS